MSPSARLSAAIEVFAEIEARRRPAADALKDWGLSHRFAGSGDRAAIAGLVYDALRRKSSAAWLMGEATPRASLLGMLRRERGLDAQAMAALCNGSRHAPPPLSDQEAAALARDALTGAPAHIEGNYPEWLDSHLARVFGDERAAEGAALASRAPLDLRVNTLAAEPVFLKGQIEIQDEGSQLAALLADAKPGEQVVDLCAGAGGKTLALAAAMGGRGQIYATDGDKRRLAPIHARIERAGAHNIQVRTPKGQAAPLTEFADRADLVLIDAPCTGSGAWRRNPDAKWRVRPGALAMRCKEQAAVLDAAAAFAKP